VNAATALVVITAEAVADAMVGVTVVGGVVCDMVGVTVVGGVVCDMVGVTAPPS
jgi:hypothetical protein